MPTVYQKFMIKYTGPISAKEFNAALLTCVRAVQKESFSDEVQQLSTLTPDL